MSDGLPQYIEPGFYIGPIQSEHESLPSRILESFHGAVRATHLNLHHRRAKSTLKRAHGFAPSVSGKSLRFGLPRHIDERLKQVCRPIVDVVIADSLIQSSHCLGRDIRGQLGP